MDMTGFGRDGLRGEVGLASNGIERKAGVAETRTARGRSRPSAPEANVASALRTAYEEAIKEDVPAEFLALLDKLS